MKRISFAAFCALAAALITGGPGCGGGDTTSTGGGGSAGNNGGGGSAGMMTGGGGSAGTAGAGGSACTTPNDCPGTDTECQQRICAGGECAVHYTAKDTPLTAQTAGDCHKAVCDGDGGVLSVIDDTDVADDGNDCTDDTCNNGVPTNAAKAKDTPCGAGGALYCDGNGKCTGCTTAAQCGMPSDACLVAVCDAGMCGTANQPNGAACNDGNACTQTDTCQMGACTAGAPVVCTPIDACHTAGTCDPATGLCSGPPVADGTPCPGGMCLAGTCVPFTCNDSIKNGAETDIDCGGGVCLGCPLGKPCNTGIDCMSGHCAAGVCVQCTAPTDCPGGPDTDCHVRTCNMNTCGINNTAAGTVTAMQAPGDCQQTQCDGNGGTMGVADDTDIPADDGNDCTSELCTAGAPVHPPKPAGAACNQNGGNQCDAAGNCLSIPNVASTTPTDGASPLAGTTIAVTFTTPMNPASLTGQTAAGACTGSIQVSLDDFASCVAFSSATASMNMTNTVATFTPAPGLLVNRSYKIRVTTAAASAGGGLLPAQYTQAMPFTTQSPNLCDGSLVISQIYGGSSNMASSYKNDYVVLHNRGTTTVDLTGLSLQYAASMSTSWGSGANKTNLTGSIPAGGYFLVQMATGNTNPPPLPTPDQIATTDLSGTAGKIALVNGTTQLPAGACPDATLTIDFVSYGATNCAEGTSALPTSITTAALRNGDGCADVNDNSLDFTVTTPLPRNSMTPALACDCTDKNESGAALEADYCNIQFPLSLTVQTGASTGMVYGQIYEATITDPAGASPLIRAQLGYGPESANPEYQPGWKWFNAAFNVQTGNNDEYQASFTAPAAGTYRYAYRYSLDRGVSWTVCDQNAGDFGAGSNGGLSFELADLPVLTVTP